MSPRDPLTGDEPVFNAPWEAQAFAMAVSLNQRGLFTWSEWAECLGEVIKAEPAISYYEQWLAALETILERKQTLKRDERLARTAAWLDAARRTPHGQPIELARLPKAEGSG